MPEEGTPGQEPEAQEADSTGSGKQPNADQKVEVTKTETTFDAEYVKSLRTEAAKNRKEATAVKAKLTELEDKDKSELEKAQKRVGELEQTTADRDSAERRLRVEIAVLRGAGKSGITDIGAAGKLLDWSAIEYEDDGAPKNIEPLLEGLVKEYPGLVGAAKPSPAFDGGVREPTDKPQSHENWLATQVFGQPKQL